MPFTERIDIRKIPNFVIKLILCKIKGTKRAFQSIESSFILASLFPAELEDISLVLPAFIPLNGAIH